MRSRLSLKVDASRLRKTEAGRCVLTVFCDLRRRRRGPVWTMTPHLCWNVCNWKTTERNQPSETQLSLSSTQTRRHTYEKKEHPHSEEGTGCSNCNKQTEETKQANSKSERNARSVRTTHSQIFFQTVSLSLTFLFFLDFLRAAFVMSGVALSLDSCLAFSGSGLRQRERSPVARLAGSANTSIMALHNFNAGKSFLSQTSVQ